MAHFMCVYPPTIDSVVKSHPRLWTPVEYFSHHGVHIYTAPNVSNRLAYHHQLFLPWQMKSILTSIPKPDILHMHGHRHLLNNVAMKLCQEWQIPSVLTANGTLRRHERKRHFKWIWDQLVSGWIPQSVSACVAVSPADERIHRSFGIEPQRIHHIPNGLDMAEFSPLPTKGEW